jgi:hypothetical protein
LEQCRGNDSACGLEEQTSKTNTSHSDKNTESSYDQGFELQLGTNCMAAFLLTQLLCPLLIKTAQTSPNGSVRVLFTASLMAELQAPKGGVNFDDLNFEKGGSQGVKYAQSKAANILIASEFAHRVRAEGVVCMVRWSPLHVEGILRFLTYSSWQSLNPGNLKSELQRHGTKLSNTFNVRLDLNLKSTPVEHLLTFVSENHPPRSDIWGVYRAFCWTFT